MRLTLGPQLRRSHLPRSRFMAAAATLEEAWTPLGVREAELRLDVTLPTGQSFR